MAGGSDQADSQVDEGTPGGAPDAIPEIALPFSLDDVPATLSGDEARTWLRGRQAQMQAGYTREVQQARQAQREAQEALELRARLEDDSTRREALSELLSPYGLELDWEEELEGQEPYPQADEFDQVPVVPPEIDERISAIEAERAHERETANEERWVNHARAGLDAFARREGLQSADDIPEVLRQQILRNAMGEPRLEDGLLDMAAAVDLFDQQRAEHQRVARAGYLESKDTPRIALGGPPADQHIDTKTAEGRIKKSLLIAQRHG
jgi:hypothetical protein